MERTGHIARRYVLAETVLLAAIAMADLLLTAYGLATGTVREANPLMAAIIHGNGPVAFILTKTLLVAVPLVFAEMARDKYAGLVVGMLRVTIVGYLALWLGGTVALNHLL